MAGRHVRRLQQQLDVRLAAPASSSEEDETDEAATATPFNPFALLTDDKVCGLRGTEHHDLFCHLR